MSNMLRKSRIFVFVALIMFVFVSGCAYVDIRTPYDDNLDKTELGTKVGMAHTYSILWLFAWGDGSYAAAAKDGDIKVMLHADQEVKQYLLGVYAKRTIIVYGN
jgi:hypothetical protein